MADSTNTTADAKKQPSKTDGQHDSSSDKAAQNTVSDVQKHLAQQGADGAYAALKKDVDDFNKSTHGNQAVDKAYWDKVTQDLKGVLPQLAIGWEHSVAKGGQPLDQQSIQTAAHSNNVVDATMANTLSAKPALSGASVDNTVALLHDSLTGDKKNEAETSRLLSTLTQQEKAQIEQAYQDKYHKRLMDDARDNFDKTDQLKVQDILNKPDDRANYAGDLAVMISQDGKNHDQANGEIMKYLSTMSASQIQQMESDYKQQFGKSFEDALKNDMSMGKDLQGALPILLKGADQRTAADNVALVKTVAQYGGKDGVDLIESALGGNNPAAQQARKDVANDKSLMDQLKSQYGGQQLNEVNDFIQNGQIQLNTIIDADHKNPANLEHALQSATPQEQAQYLVGEGLANSHQQPKDAAGQAALQFYNKVHDSLKQAAGNDSGNLSKWEGMLTGDTLTSKLAANSANPTQLMHTVENMSEQDWQALRDPQVGKALRMQLVETVSGYTNPTQQKQIFDLINQKLSANTYADSQHISQSFTQAIAGDKSAGNVVFALQHMNSDDAQKYKNDAAFRQQVDSAVNGLSGPAQAAAQDYLKQVDKTGQPPVSSALDNALVDMATNASKATTLQDIQKALQENPDFLKSNKVIPADQFASQQAIVDYATKNLTTDQANELLTKGALPLDQQLKLGLDKNYVYTQLLEATPSDRTAFLKTLNDKDKQQAEAAMLSGVQNLSGQDAQRYKTDTQFRANVDDAVNGLGGDSKVLAQHLLQQTAETGKPPVPDAVDKVLSDIVNNSDKVKTLQDLQTALQQNPNLTRDISSPQGQLTPAEQALSAYAQKQLGNDQANKLLTSGKIALDEQVKLGFPKEQIYTQLATASPSEQQAVLKELDPQQKQLAQAYISENGKPSPADLVRSYVLGNTSDPSAIAQALAGMTAAQKADMMNQYTQQYGGNLDNDLLSKLPPTLQQNYQDLLSQTQVSAQTDYANSLIQDGDFQHKVEDGSAYLGIRASQQFQDALTAANAFHQALGPEQLQQLNATVAGAAADYQAAVEKYNKDHPGFWSEVGHVAEQVAVVVVTTAVTIGVGALTCGVGGAIAGGLTYALLEQGVNIANGGSWDWTSFGENAALGVVMAAGGEAVGLARAAMVGATAEEVAASTAADTLIEGGISRGAATATGDAAGDVAAQSSESLLSRAGTLNGQVSKLGLGEDSTFAQKLAGVSARAGRNAVIGGTTNVAITAGTSVVTGQKLNGGQLLDSFEQGAAYGAGFSVAGEALAPVMARVAPGLFAGETPGVSSPKDWRITKMLSDSGVTEIPEIPNGPKLTDANVDSDGTLTYKQGDTTFKVDPKTGDYRTDTAGKSSVEYRKDGSVVAVEDPVSGTRLQANYTPGADGQPELTGFDRYKIEPSGQMAMDGSLTKTANGWVDTALDGSKRTYAAADVHVNADGSISFTGELKPPAVISNTQDTVIGQKISGDQAVSELRLEPDGSRQISFTDGTKSGVMTLDPQGRLTREVNAQGVQTELEYPPTGDQPNKVVIDGHVYERAAGAGPFIDQATGQPFADKVYTNPQNGQISFNPDSAYRVPGEAAQHQVSWINHFADGSLSIQYGSYDTGVRVPEQQFAPKTVAENFQARVADGEIKPDGNNGYIAKDGGGGTVHYDQSGHVTSTDLPDGTKLDYKYGADGQVESYTSTKDGQTETIERNAQGNFERVTADGQHQALELNGKPVNDVTVESDGSVTQWNDKFEGQRIGPDGIKVSIDSLTHEHVEATALNPERSQLENLSDTIIGGEQGARMKEFMQDFETSAKKNGISDEEIANVYYQVNKMLTTNDAVLPLQQREVLAQQLMLELAHPNTIDQGGWNVCNVTAELQNRFAVSHPEELARLAADVSTSGRFVTADGHVIDMTQVRGALTPQPDVLSTMGGKFEPNNADIDNYEGGQRNFLDQILQTSMVNEQWQTNPVGTNVSGQPASTLQELRLGLSTQSEFNADFNNRYHPGDIRYEIQGVQPGAPPGSRNLELVTNYSTGGDGQQVLQLNTAPGVDPITGRPTQVTANVTVAKPGLFNDELSQMSRAFLGYDEPPHFFVRGDSVTPNPSLTGVTDENTFAQQLLALKNGSVPGQPETRGLPATVYVDATKIAPNAANVGGYGGAHVINVQDIWQDPASGKWMVDVTNQWGAKFDGKMSLDTLWGYMEKSTPTQASAGHSEFSTPSEAVTALKNSKTMDEFFDNATHALNHEQDPTVIDAVKSRLTDEVKSPDLLKNPETLSQVRDLAEAYGLTPEIDSQIASRVSNEFKSNTDLFKHPEQIASIKELMAGMHPPNSEVMQELKARLTKEISSPDLLKDPAKAGEILDLAKAGGISNDLNSEFSKRLSNELKENKALFSDKTQLDNLKQIVAGMKESGIPFDDQFQNALFDRVQRELTNKNRGALGDMKELADQVGTMKTKNALRFYEINNFAFKGTIERQLTDAQLEGLGTAQGFRENVRGKVRPSALNQDLREIGAYLDPAAMKGSHVHSANLFDASTGSEMLDYIPVNMKDGKPYQVLGVHIKGGEIDQNYQRRIWDSVIAQYLAGLRQ